MTNGVSKKLRNHKATVTLYVAHYDLCPVYEMLRITPALALGIMDTSRVSSSWPRLRLWKRRSRIGRALVTSKLSKRDCPRPANSLALIGG